MPSTEQQQGMSPDQVMAMMKEFAKELRKPSDVEQAKIDEAKRRREDSVKILIQESKDYYRNAANQQASCSHNNGRNHTFVGQVFANGDAVAICQICRKDYKWKATMEQLQQGVDPHQWTNLTEAHLVQLEKVYPPTIPAERIKLMTQAGQKVA